MRSFFTYRLLYILGALGLVACAARPDSETKPMGENVLKKEAIQAAKSGPVSFEAHVKPVLQDKCVMCHNHSALQGHMSLENRQEAMRSGALGAYIVPGHPERSLLISNVNSAHQNFSVMPAVGRRLTKDEYEILTKWVKEGASWPTGTAGTLHVVR